MPGLTLPMRIVWPGGVSRPSRSEKWISPESPVTGPKAAARLISCVPNRPSLLTLLRSQRICPRSEEHTSELQSLMRISYAVFCLEKKLENTKHDEPIQT